MARIMARARDMVPRARSRIKARTMAMDMARMARARNIGLCPGLG